MLNFITKDEVYRGQTTPEPQERSLFSNFGGAVVDSASHAFNVLDHMLAPSGIGSEDEKRRADYRKSLAMENILDTRSNPYEYGAASNIVHQVGSVVTYGVIGGLAGPEGAAAAIAAGTGYDKYLELKPETDEATATLGGLITGATMGVGALAAPMYGKLLSTQILSAVGINVGLGMAERKAQHELLSGAGYDKMAEHYKMLDGEAVITDAILGALFPLGARAHKKLFGGTEITTQDIDAAIVADKEIHEIQRDPQLFTEPSQVIEHKNAVDDATHQVFVEGADPTTLKSPDLGDRPPNPVFEETMAATKIATKAHLEDAIGMTLKDFDQGKINAEQMAKDIAGMMKQIEDKPMGDVDHTAFAKQEIERLSAIKDDMMTPNEKGELQSLKAVMEDMEKTTETAKQETSFVKLAMACALNYGD